MSPRQTATPTAALSNPDWIEAQTHFSRWAWLCRVRPQPIGVLLADRLLGNERRRLLATPAGIKLYLDPFGFLGAKLLQTGSYEPGTDAIFRKCIKPGFTVLDVGANEGYFSILASLLAGPEGRVVAVEPQARCIEILKRNLAANGIGHCSIVEAALGDSDAISDIHLMPAFNTGASSLVRKYRWAKRRQRVRTLTGLTLSQQTGLSRFDFVKIDVEGYEPEVVEGLLPLLNAGSIGLLLIDFHHSILKQRGIKAEEIRKKLIGAGMRSTDERSDRYELYSYGISA